MRPTLAHTRPRLLRTAGLSEAALTIRWLYLRARGPMRRRPWPKPDLESMPLLRDAYYTPVWSASEAEMTRFVTNAPD